MTLANEIYRWVAPYLGYALSTIFFFALLTAGYVAANKLAKKKKEGEAEVLEEPQDNGAPKSVEALDEPASRGKASHFQMTRSFHRAARLLRSNILGQHYQYKIPWFMLIGESRVGKTTLVSQANLNLPMGKPDEDVPGKPEGCKWWFFDQGVLLDVYGDFVLRPDGKGSDQKGWLHFLKLLQKHRPQRPIDGVVLTIPCSDFMNTTEAAAETATKAGQKGLEIYEKLVQAQKVLGIRFPVYIVVTKCDAIPGFKSFCNELPKNMSNDIFGWSTPYSMEAVYSPQWLDEAFQSIYQNLYQTQLEVVADGIHVSDSDGFFLFPTELHSLLEPMKAYLNPIFKQSVYHESFFFRGVFFCGDGNIEDSQPLTGKNAEILLTTGKLPAAAAGGGLLKRILFVKGLLEKKIFPEYQLARPTEKIFIWRSRATWTARIATVAAALIWLLGVSISYENLFADKRSMLPMLKNLSINLKKLKVRGGEEEESERDFFDKAALNLLEGMTEIGATSFKSFFIPSSWYSPVDGMIQKTMVLAYDKIILKSIYFGLQQKLGKITADAEITAASGERSAAPRSIEETPEFIKLQSLVNELNTLWRNIEAYNGLTSSQDITVVASLVKYIFGTTLPETFYKNAFYYHTALRNIDYVTFDPKVDKYLVTIPHMKQLANALYGRLFQSNDVLLQMREFGETLGKLRTEGRTLTPKERAAIFREITDAITRLQDKLSRPEAVWLSREQLDLGPAFTKVLEAAGNSPFLGGELRRELEEVGQEQFQRLKAQLRAQETELTGSVLGTENDRLQIALSKDALDLKKSLQNFLQQKFMQDLPARRELITDVGARTRLFWTTSGLENAMDLYHQYDAFLQKDVPAFPAKLRPLVKKAALQNLEMNMLEHIAQAQEIKSLPAENLAFMRPESDLSAEIRSFKKSEELLGGLADVFNKLEMTDSSWELSNLATAHAFNLLIAVDQLAREERSYEFKDGNFAWWNGQIPAAFAAFEARDEKELAFYLDLQRERLKHLAREYAEPLLMYLVNRTINRGQAEDKLVSRWQRILREFEHYEAKKTGNSVQTTEKYIIQEMNSITVENCAQKLDAAKDSGVTGDFFLEKLGHLRQQMRKQCLFLANNQIARDYAKVETLFNQKLAGYYPFVSPQGEAGAAEADPQVIREFYWSFDQFVKKSLKLLENNSHYGLSGDEALEFIYRLEEARPFFAALLDPAEMKKTPSYLVDIDFRVNRKFEVGANQIIAWELEIGDQKATNNDLKKKTLIWELGSPIRLTLRWAKDAVYMPAAVAYQEAKIKDKAVTYTYDNAWSLIKFILNNASSAEDFERLQDLKPNTLKFEIKTREWEEEKAKKGLYLPAMQQAKAFIRVEVKNPKQKEPLTLPALPGKAPHLIAAADNS